MTQHRPDAVAVAFYGVKQGNPEWEWEDCAGYDESGSPSGNLRCIVVDGATEAYDALRWVRLLVNTFLGRTGGKVPAIGADDLEQWFGRVQQEWVSGAPTEFRTVFEARKFHRLGSFATLLCCDVEASRDGTLRWVAASLGDTVLFHVRDQQLVESFPFIEDFGINPSGVYTAPSTVPSMLEELQFTRGKEPVQAGDTLFVATDAMAAWMLTQQNGEDGVFWQLLSSLADEDTFARLIAQERGAGRLKNDDVTLLRVEFVDSSARGC